jgi:hypothetical protein
LIKKKASSENCHTTETFSVIRTKEMLPSWRIYGCSLSLMTDLSASESNQKEHIFAVAISGGSIAPDW